MHCNVIIVTCVINIQCKHQKHTATLGLQVTYSILYLYKKKINFQLRISASYVILHVDIMFTVKLFEKCILIKLYMYGFSCRVQTFYVSKHQQ